MIEMKKEFVFSHCAISKSFTQRLNTFVTDLICAKVEFGEILNEKMIVEDDRNEERVCFLSLCNFEELHSKIEHLCHRFDLC